MQTIINKLNMSMIKSLNNIVIFFRKEELYSDKNSTKSSVLEL